MARIEKAYSRDGLPDRADRVLVLEAEGDLSPNNKPVFCEWVFPGSLIKRSSHTLRDMCTILTWY